ncbi:hypothetical protein [Litchfieldia alkalitelluris]|nr:hypothetical protein [Litchfieldia alkalitelluris]
MSNYGSLHEEDGRQVLVFERKYPFSPEKVSRLYRIQNSLLSGIHLQLGR